MRVHITGNAGAGKTTLATIVGEKFDLPVFHLDQVVWMSHWRKATMEERKPRERKWISKPTWVIEGVSREVREAADIVIFLDVPRYKCAWRCIKRGSKLMFRTRPEMPEHCPEIMIIPRVLKIIWKFPSLFQKQIVTELYSSNKFFIITQPEQIHDVLARFEKEIAT